MNDTAPVSLRRKNCNRQTDLPHRLNQQEFSTGTIRAIIHGTLWFARASPGPKCSPGLAGAALTASSAADRTVKLEARRYLEVVTSKARFY